MQFNIKVGVEDLRDELVTVTIMLSRGEDTMTALMGTETDTTDKERQREEFERDADEIVRDIRTWHEETRARPQTPEKSVTPVRDEEKEMAAG